jgi:hypothetical protein
MVADYHAAIDTCVANDLRPVCTRSKKLHMFGPGMRRILDHLWTDIVQKVQVQFSLRFSTNWRRPREETVGDKRLVHVRVEQLQIWFYGRISWDLWHHLSAFAQFWMLSKLLPHGRWSRTINGASSCEEADRSTPPHTISCPLSAESLEKSDRYLLLIALHEFVYFARARLRLPEMTQGKDQTELWAALRTRLRIDGNIGRKQGANGQSNVASSLRDSARNGVL